MPVCHCIRLSGKCKAHHHCYSFLIHIFAGASASVPRAFVVFSHSLCFFLLCFRYLFSFYRIPFPFKNALLYAAARCGKISVCESVHVAQLDRALDSDSKGQRFESSRVHSSSRTTPRSRRLFYSKKVISRPFRADCTPFATTFFIPKKSSLARFVAPPLPNRTSFASISLCVFRGSFPALRLRALPVLLPFDLFIASFPSFRAFAATQTRFKLEKSFAM